VGFRSYPFNRLLHHPFIMEDTEIIKRLTILFPKAMAGVEKAVDQFSPFDFSNKRYLIEVKSRRKRYDPWIIEKSKVDSNYDLATETDREILYVSEHEGVAHVWNIMKLLEEEYDFGWCQKNLPRTTDFSRREWVKKDIGYVYEKDATSVNLLTS